MKHLINIHNHHFNFILIILLFLLLVKPISCQNNLNKKIEISFLAREFESLLPFWKEKISEFENLHKDVKINLRHEDFGTASLSRMIDEKTLPDVAWIDETIISKLFKEKLKRKDVKLIEPIPSEIFDHNQIKKIWGPTIAKVFKMEDGEYYFLPNGMMTALLFCNEEILLEYGYQADDIPREWDDFIKIAGKLTKRNRDKSLRQRGFSTESGLKNGKYLWDAMFIQQGGAFIDRLDDQGLPSSGLYKREQKEYAKKALLYLNKIFKGNDKIDDLKSRRGNIFEFGEDKAAFAFNWSWLISFLENPAVDYPVKGHYYVTHLPSFTGKPPYGRMDYNVGFVVFGLDTDQKIRDAKWKFYRFLLSGKFQKEFALKRGMIPARKDLREDEEFNRPPWKRLNDIFRKGWTIYPGPLSESLEKVYDDLYTKVIYLDKPIDEALKQAEIEADSILRAGDCKLMRTRKEINSLRQEKNAGQSDNLLSLSSVPGQK